MQPEQPQTPSADVSQSEAQAAPADSQAAESESSGGLSWWDRLLGRRAEDRETPGSGKPDQAGSAAQAPKPLTLTQEELERRIQSETDRREAKRMQDARAQHKRELRDKDPWAYAEQERKDEEAGMATGQLTQFLANVGTEHDRVSIDPVLQTLPEAERQRILSLQGAGVGLEGRKLVVNEALRALEKHWKAEGEKQAEAKLRRNPAFRKQVLGEVRGATPEPELLPAVGPSTADQTMSAILRKYYDLPSPSN